MGFSNSPRQLNCIYTKTSWYERFHVLFDSFRLFNLDIDGEKKSNTIK